jgi:two-component system alkaline phosphatase synthesis response regulator PhoP
MMKYKILIIDDDFGLAQALRDIMITTGYEADIARNGEEGLSKIKENRPDLVLLDWMMPKMDGCELCQHLKEDERTSNIPIIMLTVRNEKEDEIEALSIGADDYISKPFNYDILTARVNALLRRNIKSREMKIGELYINLDTHTLLIKEKSIELRPKEFEVLYFLMSHRDEAVSRNTLSEEIWGYQHLDSTRAIDETIKCLRDKLGSQAKKIKTVVGIGYKFSSG